MKTGSCTLSLGIVAAGLTLFVSAAPAAPQ